MMYSRRDGARTVRLRWYSASVFIQLARHEHIEHSEFSTVVTTLNSALLADDAKSLTLIRSLPPP